jgi:hypothetical protein
MHAEPNDDGFMARAITDYCVIAFSHCGAHSPLSPRDVTSDWPREW